MKVGFIGTGLMGAPMAKHVLAAGHQVSVWNRTAAKCEPLLALGAAWQATPADVAKAADVLVLMLTDAAAVEAVLFAQAAAQTLAPGSLVIDMSSIPPHAARAHAAKLAAADIDHLDAPVSGGSKGAAAASLAIMVGGTVAAFARAVPLFSCLGRPTHVGPHGAGQIAKLANQMIVAITLGAVAEALTFASEAGADATAVRRALAGGFADSRILQEHGARMLANEFEPGGTVRNQIKDLDAALFVASERGLNFPLLGLTREQFVQLARGFGDQLDHSAIYKLVRAQQAQGVQSLADAAKS